MSIATRKQEHSKKPDQLYDIIQRCSPGPYCELSADSAWKAGLSGETKLTLMKPRRTRLTLGLRVRIVAVHPHPN